MQYIRVERDGSWFLHLEAFEAELPCLTVYDRTNYIRWGPAYLADMKTFSTTAPEVYSEFMTGNVDVKRNEKRFNHIPIDQDESDTQVKNGIITIKQMIGQETNFVLHGQNVQMCYYLDTC